MSWSAGMTASTDPEGGPVTVTVASGPSWLTVPTTLFITYFSASPLLADIGTSPSFSLALSDGVNTPVVYAFSVHVTSMLSSTTPVA